MKTPSILCIGTHYPRYESFITELRKSFHIYAFRSLEIPEGDDSAVTFIDDVVPINCMPEDFTTAATAMVDIRTRLQGLLNPSCNITQTVPVTPQLERYYYQMILESLVIKRAISQLFEQRKIDVVISTGCYIGYVRPAVQLARKLGIPTVDMLHGRIGAMPPSNLYHNGETWAAEMLITDYLIVDNALEASYFKEKPGYPCLEPRTKIMEIGTPIEESLRSNLNQEQAREHLGLANKPTIGVLSTWEDTRSINMWQLKIDEGMFYKETFETLASLQRDRDFQVVLKPHPSYTLPEVYPGWKEFILRSVAKSGLKNFHVFDQGLEEVIASSDILLSNSWTSAMWNGLAASKQIYLHILPSPARERMCPKTAQDSNDFYRAGLIQTSSSAQELENHLRAGLDIGPPPGFENEFESILARHGITSEAPAQKNTRVINFLAELAVSGATKPRARVGAA